MFGLGKTHRRRPGDGTSSFLTFGCFGVGSNAMELEGSGRTLLGS